MRIVMFSGRALYVFSDPGSFAGRARLLPSRDFLLTHNFRRQKG
jgi:hypothetical protein